MSNNRTLCNFSPAVKYVKIRRIYVIYLNTFDLIDFRLILKICKYKYNFIFIMWLIVLECYDVEYQI